ncbi:MAG: formylglycine-generating enzyme family protein [Deltaproteobacteria bacterium]|nr:formylglycine-generating enzyme family protein [Deltaproteobacteria bacterium]
MVHIPGATFEPAFAPAPGITRIDVSAFFVDRRPVTNGEFLQFVREYPRFRRSSIPGILADKTYLSHWSNDLDPGEGVSPNQPVTHVSWFAAKAYCEARGDRLPSWVEWEYVAAADETRRDARSDAAWQQRILDWYARPSHDALPNVGMGSANIYGVQDLHGLIWEWVSDFHAMLIRPDSRDDGGRFFCGAGATAAADKSGYAIFMRVAFLSSVEARYTTANLGFRCARDVAGKRETRP